MSKFKSYRTESREDWGIHSNNGENLNRDQIQLGALLRMADGIEETNRLLTASRWCSFRHAVERIANKGITIRHEHSLTFKFRWSIRWPWQQKARRRQRTWRLFGKKEKK
jgi:hypothetical protein